MQNFESHESRYGCYEIVRELAHGRYSTVYEAKHTHPNFHDRHVALKVLRNWQSAQHFMNSLRLHACFRHPRIPPIYDVAHDGRGQIFAARMLVEGDDLQNGIGNTGRTFAQVAANVTEVAVALDYAHGLGVVHGYVHPRHMLFGRDESTWLIGFGEYPPASDAHIGNPLHFAPEQLQGAHRATPATDVYALCETTIWLLTGQHPFHGFHGAGLFRAKRRGQLWRAIRDLIPGISSRLEGVFRRGLAVDPRARYATAFDFASAFSSAVEEGIHPRRWWLWS